ncbi:unnamed protein product [Rotaria sp. Silwood2]|nr:unnamed protein product [Rotaria sp. Silwood2]CAF3428458.1 unnamed protein product [Rotaria sp. Silwood2]
MIEKTAEDMIFWDEQSQFQYEPGFDVKMNNQLYGRPGQIVYDAEWMRKKKSPIVLILINTETAKCEASFYIELSSYKHIVHTFGVVKNDPRSTMLIQERVPHDNLLTLLKRQILKPSTKILNIIHGDLRCDNVLIFKMNQLETKENLIKLTNFALTCPNDPSFINNRQTSISIRYAAPEIIASRSQSNYSELSDVYSMGILMWEACS